MAFGTDEFVSFLGPPGDKIKDYDRTLPHDQQPDTVPPVFLDAMAVREVVFVEEQGVPFENELDADDARACHFVAYASVARRRSQVDGSVDTESPTPDPLEEPRSRRESAGSTAIKVPAAVIRLIPPHDPATSEPTAQTAPPPSIVSNEPYALLGRLAVSPAYRRLGLGRLLVNAALQWARDNGKFAFKSRLTPAEIEARRVENPDFEDESVWKGLIAIHAQQGDAETFWTRMGFVVDEGMGTWEEEGIMHVGMWKRIP